MQPFQHGQQAQRAQEQQARSRFVRDQAAYSSRRRGPVGFLGGLVRLVFGLVFLLVFVAIAAVIIGTALSRASDSDGGSTGDIGAAGIVATR